MIISDEYIKAIADAVHEKEVLLCREWPSG